MMENYELRNNEAEERCYKRGVASGKIAGIKEFCESAIEELQKELFLDEYKDQIIERVMNELASRMSEIIEEGWIE